MIELVKILAPTVAALAAFATSYLNGRKANEIKVLVNGELSSVKSELVMAHQEIKELREFIVKMKPSQS